MEEGAQVLNGRKGDLQERERESEFLEELVMRTYKVDFIMSGAK